MAAPDLPEVLTERGFGDVSKPVTITWTSTAAEAIKGTVTIAGTNQVAPDNTKWVFTDPTPVWRCFSGVRTRHFEEGMGVAAQPTFWLEVGKRERHEGGLVIYALDRAVVGGPRWAPEGGDWRFDPVATERLAKLLSSTPPTELGTSTRR